MVVKSVLSAGVKQLTKGLSKKAAAETVELIGRQTMNDIGELVIKDPSRLKYVTEAITSNPRNFKALNDITQEAATQKYNSQLATKTQNFASGNQNLDWVTHTSSPLGKKGMRKNIKSFGYSQRQVDPAIAPKEIQNKWDQEMGSRTIDGEEQLVVSGGSTPTKASDISVEGQRPLQLQDKSKNQARKISNQKNIRDPHAFTSPEAADNFKKLDAEAKAASRKLQEEARARGETVRAGEQLVHVEHDIALRAKGHWDRVGYTGNDPGNLFVQYDPDARQFKDNIENWLYPKSKTLGIRTDKTNMRDLIIFDVNTGEQITVIKMPDDFTKTMSGIPQEIKNILKELAAKAKRKSIDMTAGGKVSKFESGILHSPTGTGDQAFDNVVNALKDNPNAFDTSGMGGSINISDRD